MSGTVLAKSLELDNSSSPVIHTKYKFNAFQFFLLADTGIAKFHPEINPLLWGQSKKLCKCYKGEAHQPPSLVVYIFIV